MEINEYSQNGHGYMREGGEIIYIVSIKSVNRHKQNNLKGLLKTYIYICIFTNQLSTSIHGTRKKQKTPGQEQEKENISNPGPEEKEKSFLG